MENNCETIYRFQQVWYTDQKLVIEFDSYGSL